MSLDRSAPFGVIVDYPAPNATVWTNAFHQGFQDRIDGRWTFFPFSVTGTQTNLSITDSFGREADYLAWTGTSLLTLSGMARPSRTGGGCKPITIRNYGASGANIFIPFNGT